MLPLFIVLSILAFFDGSSYAATTAAPRWRPDLRARGSGINVNTSLHARNTLEGIAATTPIVDNSTIVPVALSSDKM